ncbi:MAG: hypothetical protein IPP29_12380 [Bacteroidetes bacterium]|nr:hypothetical protein [Bacteroidota bacterium]
MSVHKKKIQNRIADYLLQREIKHHKRNAKTVSFVHARTIGILYDATHEDDYETIKEYVKHFRDQKKEVLALGYVDLKEMPAMRFSKLGLDFFTFKNLNWVLKPAHPMVDKFIHANFDILINLNIQKCLPLKYLAAITKASFKIGRYESRHQQYLDFMIKTNESVTLKQFIELTNKYIKIIGNGTNQIA